jgi:ectoine hydroxylase-related dioxygenase (phytanoyl-CoA dioxygenase family)
LNKEKQTTGSVKQGDLLLFNSLLVHRSGTNTSDKYRWVANGRFGTTDDQELVYRNYYMARTKYPNYFSIAHPDLVVTEDAN